MVKVLYVDDEADIREIAAMSLELDPAIKVQTCDSGAAGLVAAQHWLPDLILLDVMMPGMDGPTTFSKLRSYPNTAAIPVVFITARTQARDVETLLEMGAAGVIAKPFDPMQLAHQVRAFL